MVWCFGKLLSLFVQYIQLSRPGRFCTKYLFLQTCGEKLLIMCDKKKRGMKEFAFPPDCGRNNSYKDNGRNRSYTDFGRNNLTYPFMVATTLIKIMVRPTRLWSVATTADIPLLQEKDARNLACGTTFSSSLNTLFLISLSYCEHVFRLSFAMSLFVLWSFLMSHKRHFFKDMFFVIFYISEW